ncbi:MAG: hypothetical protein IJA67_10575 [Oscillospiraceae bacterium]|nr:hypothetical protein [Oscillospiraceae bacterium]
MKKLSKALKIILLIFGYAGVLYTLWQTKLWYEHHYDLGLLVRIWFPVICGLIAMPSFMWDEWVMWKETESPKAQPAERVISYDRLMAALDSLVGTETPRTMWEQGYDECLAQVYDFVDCIEKEDGV